MLPYIKTYLEKTPTSARLYERAVKVMPGGVSHNPRYFAPYPLYIKKVQGSRLWDVDGNEYIDLWMGHYSHILGHRPEIIQDALREGIEEGTHWGIVHERQVALAEDICRLLPAVERLRFGVSGTEATMYAVRLARGFTGRKVVLKVRGGWHGAGPDLTLAIRAPMETAESAGLLPEMSQYTQTIPFNDLETSLAVIRRHRDDLAGVIMEAVGQYFIPPLPGYLEEVEKETKKAGGLFILDEVITGFRLALRGAHGRYRLHPDLMTFGKVLGGGMPLAVLGGRRDVLDLASPTAGLPKGAGVLIGGGTFSEMPLALKTGQAMLRYLERHEQEIYPALEEKGKRVREGIEKILRDRGIPALCNGVGSLFNTSFVPDGAKPRNIEEMDLYSDTEMRDQLFRICLLNHGVYTKYGGGALSLAHSDEDIEQIFSAVRRAADDMAELT